MKERQRRKEKGRRVRREIGRKVGVQGVRMEV